MLCGNVPSNRLAGIAGQRTNELALRVRDELVWESVFLRESRERVPDTIGDVSFNFATCPEHFGIRRTSFQFFSGVTLSAESP